MHIGVDIDGVIANTFYLLVHELNAYFSVDFTLEDISEYNIYKMYGVNQDEINQFILSKENILISGPNIMPEAEYYLRLLKFKHEISLISARQEKYFHLTKQWMQKYKIPYHHLILWGQHDKREICVNLAINLFIEDSLKNAVQINTCGIPVIFILFDAPYNQGCLPEKIWRCRSWKEIYQVVDRVARSEKVAGTLEQGKFEANKERRFANNNDRCFSKNRGKGEGSW